MKKNSSHIKNKKDSVKSQNPFIQLMEDKLKIAKAYQENRPLSSLGVPFVKPL